MNYRIAANDHSEGLTGKANKTINQNFQKILFPENQPIIYTEFK